MAAGGGAELNAERKPPGDGAWAVELLRHWNGADLDALRGSMTADLQVEAPVTKGGAPGGVLYRTRDEFLAACPEIRARVGELELVSALGDEASASLVLRDGAGELLTLLLAFDPDGLIARIASFRRSRPLAAGLRAPT